MAPPERQYWALFANPQRYRIEQAVRALTLDSWTSQGSALKPGDRVAIWKGKGRDEHRGIIALGEVLTHPELTPADDSRYYVDPSLGTQPKERVQVRYIHSPALPLWIGGSADELLRDLTISRTQGGTVFRITPEQWEALMTTIGGWPGESPEVLAALDALAESAGKPVSRQGFRVSSEERKAIEEHAMAQAIAHFTAEGWNVMDVSRTSPFDLRCTRPSGDELHVEVKGTTSDGTSVLLTQGEVEHARVFPNTALFIVSHVELSAEPRRGITAMGGRHRVIQPWQIEAVALQPLAFQYRVPDSECPPPSV
jgi:hypothetical protein